MTCYKLRIFLPFRSCELRDLWEVATGEALNKQIVRDIGIPFPPTGFWNLIWNICIYTNKIQQVCGGLGKLHFLGFGSFIFFFRQKERYSYDTILLSWKLKQHHLVFPCFCDTWHAPTVHVRLKFNSVQTQQRVDEVPNKSRGNLWEIHQHMSRVKHPERCFFPFK